MKGITTGVPQGSTLGPLLFLLYINDLPNAATDANNLMFADDTALYVSGNKQIEIQTKLQQTLNKVKQWCDENQLTLNAKTQYVLFTPKRKEKNYRDITLKIGTQEIERVTKYKYLGTILDSKLTGIPQYHSLLSQMSVIKATILPIIDYNDTVYNLHTEQYIRKLQTLQNRALRTV